MSEMKKFYIIENLQNQIPMQAIHTSLLQGQGSNFPIGQVSFAIKNYVQVIRFLSKIVLNVVYCMQVNTYHFILYFVM